MNDEQRAEHAGLILGLLERFERKYGWTPTAEDEREWWARFEHTPWSVLETAAKDYAAHEEYAPKGGKFARFADQYVGKHLRIAARQDEGGDCPHCDGGWMESRQVETASGKEGEITYPPGVYPCSHCQPPERQERWRDVWVPEGRRLRPVNAITAATTFAYNPAEAVKRAKAIASAARSADEL